MQAIILNILYMKFYYDVVYFFKADVYPAQFFLFWVVSIIIIKIIICCIIILMLCNPETFYYIMIKKLFNVRCCYCNNNIFCRVL